MFKKLIKKLKEFIKQVSKGIDETQYKNGYGKV
jgi:hypothetical protein